MRRPRDPVLTKTVQYLDAKLRSEDLKKTAEDLKKELLDEVARRGSVAHDGHAYLDLSIPVTVGDKTYQTLKREKRVMTTTNEDKLVALAERKGVRDRIFKTIEVLDSDEVYVLYQEGVITEEELDECFDREVTWAFRPLAD